jgi:SHS2 domain-containing protein
MEQGGYERMEHTGEETFRLHGRTHAQLFAAAGRAFLSILTDPEAVRLVESRRFSLAADDIEELLVDWLNELVYVFDTDALLFSRFDVSHDDGRRLEVEARGERHDEERHPVRTTVKAATHHGLDVRRTAGGWQADVTFDV